MTPSDVHAFNMFRKGSREGAEGQSHVAFLPKAVWSIQSVARNLLKPYTLHSPTGSIGFSLCLFCQPCSASASGNGRFCVEKWAKACGPCARALHNFISRPTSRLLSLPHLLTPTPLLLAPAPARVSGAVHSSVACCQPFGHLELVSPESVVPRYPCTRAASNVKRVLGAVPRRLNV